MREAVIQTRLVLDLLTSHQGGVCKMLGVSCCFHITDNSDNITDIVEHMKRSIPEPEREVTLGLAGLAASGADGELGFFILLYLLLYEVCFCC